MTLTALDLAGVTIAGVAAATLAESLHQVTILGVNLRTLQKLAPRSSMDLAWPVVEFWHSAAFNQSEGSI